MRQPEKKMYTVAQAVIAGSTPAKIDAMLNDPNTAPRSTRSDWADLAQNQMQLPPEAWDVLDAEGIPAGSFGPYRFVTCYMNNELSAGDERRCGRPPYLTAPPRSRL